MATTWRQQQAQQTRQQIAAAARRLFVEHGYRTTTIEAIAGAAGVAVPTVYKVFGNKRSIARELNDLIDAEAGVGPLVERVLGSDDPAEIVDLSVQIGRSVHENCGDIVALVHAAADSEPELAAVAAEGMRRHVSGVRIGVRRLQELGALPDGASVDHMAGLLGQLTSAETFATLTGDHSWSLDECSRWLAEACATLLLRPAAPPRSAGV